MDVSALNIDIADILMGLITIFLVVISELLRRILKQMGHFGKHLTVLETKIALCPHCPKENRELQL